MIYLDNAATTMIKPKAVRDAVLAAMDRCASIGRSAHRAAEQAAQLALDCRLAAAELFDASPDQVVFTFNATHGLNLAIHSLVEPGDRVVISGFEHNAVLRPLYGKQADIRIAGRRLFDPDDTAEAFDRAIDSKTKAVICTHVSNVFGYILPIGEIGEICRRKGVPLIIDASQSAGILPVSLNHAGAAFVAMPGHKGLYGPQGTGILLCAEPIKPLLFGGTGSLSASADMPEFLPDRAEAGTLNTPGIAGLLEGIRFVCRKGTSAILEHEQALTQTLIKLLNTVPVQVFAGDETCQSGVISFTASSMDCQVLGRLLGERDVAVRAGLHCAPLAHESGGTLETGTLRISLSDFNTKQELDAVSSHLDEILNP